MDTNLLPTTDNAFALQKMVNKEYKYGFTTDIETEYFPCGLNEDIIGKIIELKQEPTFLSAYRKKSFEIWKKMDFPQ